MFEPDLFSDPRPTFIAASSVNSGAVLEVLAHGYPTLGAGACQVRQSGSIEVNSNNFLVEASTGRFVAKRWPKATMEVEVAARSRQAELANWLAAEGLPFPRILPASTGTIILERSGHDWCVMEYVEGEYFSGHGNELLEAGKTIVRLFLALARLPAELEGGHVIAPPDPASLDFMQRLKQGRNHWEAIFGASYAQLLVDSWDQISADLADIVRPSALAPHYHSCHIDLHPHNILMRDGRLVAILDFGSFARATRAAIIPFNLFKLARQAAVARGGNVEDAGLHAQLNAVIDELVEHELLDGDMRGGLAQLAKAEIMRRLLLILSLAYEKSNRDWIHVLPVQINALSEADALFG